MFAIHNLSGRVVLLRLNGGREVQLSADPKEPLKGLTRFDISNNADLEKLKARRMIDVREATDDQSEQRPPAANHKRTSRRMG